MTDVFVSYATPDRAKALPIVERLEKLKLKVYWDRSIPAGKKWQEVLELQLRKAKCVVVLLSRESLGSSWVTFEASIAFERRILVPLLLDAHLNPQTDLPEMYRDLHIGVLPNDHGLRSSIDSSEPWLRAIQDTVRQSARRKSLKLSVLIASALFGIFAAVYILLTSHNVLTTWQAGLKHVERGAYSKQENERLKSAIRNATLIELFVPNATSFTSAFRDDLPIFLKKPGSSMRVLFADPTSTSYDAMMTMTSKGIERDSKARESDKGLPARSRRILLGLTDDQPDKLKFRQFDTEFRIPMILVDRKYCFLTIRLTPDQSTDSLRLELASKSAGSRLEQAISSALESLAFTITPSSQRQENIESCKRHFDAVWERSKEFE